MACAGVRIGRRRALRLAAAGAVASVAPARFALGRRAKVRIGFLLPYSGPYARLGAAITNAVELKFAETGGVLAGREMELIKVDSEAAPLKAPELTARLIHQEKADVLVGPVHSEVALGMAMVARAEGILMIDAHAGANQITGPLCAPNIFRTSFSNWQAGYPLGKVLREEGKKTVVLCYWDYVAGQQMAQGFKEGFLEGGGTVVKEIGVPFPEVDFQPALTEIASIKPEVVYAFFAGAGAVKFVKDWHALGMRETELVGPGFLTEGVTRAQGEAAEGLRTTLHYADTLDNPANKAFRQAYRERLGEEADVYAVQGYDAAELIRVALEAVEGDIGARDDVIRAIEGAEIASPRGPFKLSAAHNPVQNIYLRQVRNGENAVVRIAHEMLADPAEGCTMG